MNVIHWIIHIFNKNKETKKSETNYTASVPKKIDQHTQNTQKNYQSSGIYKGQNSSAIRFFVNIFGRFNEVWFSGLAIKKADCFPVFLYQRGMGSARLYFAQDSPWWQHTTIPYRIGRRPGQGPRLPPDTRTEVSNVLLVHHRRFEEETTSPSALGTQGH